jgi:bifunctional DNase/RNase
VKHVDLVGVHVEAVSGTPLVLLQEHDEPHRVLPIFVGASEAVAIAVAASGQIPPRPLTHDLIVSLIGALDARVDAVEVTGMRDGAFLAEVALSAPDGRRRVDSRPSDAIALAVRVGAPVFVTNGVLDVAGVTLRTAPHDGVADERAIDEAVEEFRRLLDDIDPADLAAAISDESSSPPTASDSGELDDTDDEAE